MPIVIHPELLENLENNNVSLQSSPLTMKIRKTNDGKNDIITYTDQSETYFVCSSNSCWTCPLASLVQWQLQKIFLWIWLTRQTFDICRFCRRIFALLDESFWSKNFWRCFDSLMASWFLRLCKKFCWWLLTRI